MTSCTIREQDDIYLELIKPKLVQDFAVKKILPDFLM